MRGHGVLEGEVMHSIYSPRPKFAVFARLDQTAVPATIASTRASLTTRYDPVKHQIRKFQD